MHRFRSHSIRVHSLVLLLTGLALNIASLTDQKVTHEAFTSWLGSHLQNDDSEAHKKLNILSNDKSGLDEVIRKASKVVASHADDFTLPVSENEETNQELVYRLLLTQWNQFQHTEAGMSKAVLFETAKSHTILLNDGKFDHLDGNTLRKITSKKKFISLHQSEFPTNSDYFLSPLKSGIAINAP